ncbi:MAG: lysine--tRNA ligase [Candidatus Pacearchaeota archaeon]
MGREELIISERIKKLEEIRKLGINPYPHKYDPNSYSKDIKEKYKDLKNNERTNDFFKIAGRVMTIRDLGKLIFATLQDFKGRIQIIFQIKETEKFSFDLFKKFIDIGDIIGVEGIVMKTKTGEISILSKKMTILAKSILPLPEKWHGLTDKEERYRKRYIDLIMNPEVKEVFEKKTKIIDEIRRILKDKEFLEVDTPYLQPLYGGANAKPFETYLNSLNMKLYLAISPELYLKRLIVGGYDKVFTISRNFRNEGIDRWHNPEFTMLEAYSAYSDYNDMMNLFEEIYETICIKINGSTKVNFKGVEIDFKRPWKRMTMLESIKKFAGIDLEKMSDEKIDEFVKRNNLNPKGDTWGWKVQAIFEHFCESKLEQPVFIIDHPLETTPLCKTHRNDKLLRLIERFEPFCMGVELGNAYSELNDPILQRKLLEEQQKMLSNGNEEANPLDQDFINAIEIGMPPTGGLGLGIDRMIMILTGQESIRDVLLFPFMKPERSNLEIKKIEEKIEKIIQKTDIEKIEIEEKEKEIEKKYKKNKKLKNFNKKILNQKQKKRNRKKIKQKK